MLKDSLKDAFLVTSFRRRLVRPHKVATAIADHLRTLAELFDAAGPKVAERELWAALAQELERAAGRLRELFRGGLDEPGRGRDRREQPDHHQPK